MRGGSRTLEAGEEASMPPLVGRTYQITKGDSLTVRTLEDSVGEHASIEGVKRGRGHRQGDRAASVAPGSLAGAAA